MPEYEQVTKDGNVFRGLMFALAISSPIWMVTGIVFLYWLSR